MTDNTKNKIFQVVRKILSKLPISEFEQRLLLKPLKDKAVYKSLVVLDLSRSKEMVLK